jgi:TonB family protein
MRFIERSTLWYGVLAALSAATAGAQSGPGPGDSVSRARVAPTYNAVSRCPSVRQTDLDDPNSAIVQLYVGPTGVPSNASIKTSSQSETLDSAALACVKQLRYLPATRLGDATAVASWQIIAWKSAPMRTGVDGAAAAAAAPVAAAAATAGSARSGEGRAEVRVCVDESGKLTQDPQITHSSGDTQFDQAAINIAKAASGSYRARTGQNGAPGCLQIALRSERN